VNQYATPLFDAVRRYINDGVIPFHVPGHRQGRGIPEMLDYIGAAALQMDLNGMQDLDYINHPCGVIREAQQLLAQAFAAQESYFLVNGTTSGVQAMIMSACQPGDKIILPRNAHRSTIGGIILSGAVPVYIPPEIDSELGIAMGVTPESLETAISRHPDARAVFLIHPTYYGFTSDIQTLIELAHRNNIAVLADEAHGAHLGFHPQLPISAMQAGADLSAASMHKTAGSLTQSSVLLYKSQIISSDRVRETVNLAYTSSASYLLLCSLDLARKQLATRGPQLLSRVLDLVNQARQEINRLPGLYAFSSECTGQPGAFAFDETKLGIHVRGLGYTGYEIEEKLRRKYNLQIELSDLYNILIITSFGHDEADLQALVQALEDITTHSIYRPKTSLPPLPPGPEMVVPPREAFYSRNKAVPLKMAVGEIAAEMVMAYPPGIPVICMGERITGEIIDYLLLLKKQSCALQGTADPQVNYIRVLSGK
jgi:arginine decarboxylase